MSENDVASFNQKLIERELWLKVRVTKTYPKCYSLCIKRFFYSIVIPIISSVYAFINHSNMSSHIFYGIRTFSPINFC